jgi:hypothetical protein
VTPGRTLAVLVLTALSVSCAGTTYDSSINVGTVAPTTTIVPVGTAAELLPTLVTEAAGISKLILDKGDKASAIARIEALWKAVSDEVTKHDRDLAIEIEAEIAKSSRAARLNIPGGADKAYRNLTTLVKAYLASA